MYYSSYKSIFLNIDHGLNPEKTKIKEKFEDEFNNKMWKLFKTTTIKTKEYEYEHT